MQINIDKTKTLIFRRHEAKTRNRLKLNGTDLEDVDSFFYLGAKITWNNDSTEEIKRRIQLATGAYGELRTVWKDKGPSLATIYQHSLYTGIIYFSLQFQRDTPFCQHWRYFRLASSALSFLLMSLQRLCTKVRFHNYDKE